MSLALALGLGAMMGCMSGESLKGDGGRAGADAAGQAGSFAGGGGPSTQDAGPVGDTASAGADGTDTHLGGAGMGGDVEAGSSAGADAGPRTGADATGPDGSATPDVRDAGTGTAGPASYEAEDGSLFGQATVVVCASCSNGKRVNLKSDSGVSIRNIDANGPGTHMVAVSYTNGDSKGRTLYIGVNGGDSQAFFSVFKPTGGWDKVAKVTLSLDGFRWGTNNVISFFIDTEQPPPDLDRMEMLPATSHTAAP